MKHRVLVHGAPSRFTQDTVGLHMDHLVMSSDANYGSLNATVLYVLPDKVIDFLQPFSGHPDLFRTSVR